MIKDKLEIKRIPYYDINYNGYKCPNCWMLFTKKQIGTDKCEKCGQLINWVDFNINK